MMPKTILVGLMFVTLLPFVTMFSASLAPSGTYPPGLQWPSDPQWQNYVEAFKDASMDRLLLSSTIIAVFVVPVSVFIGTLAGFGLSALAPRGHRFIYLLFVLGLTLPFEGVITPLYYEVRALGLLNTKFAIILPLIGLFMPFSVYWMHAHFVNVPSELSEAAQIDGASTWQHFWLVQVPIARPAITSLAILQFLWTWNQFLLAGGAGREPTRANDGWGPRRLSGAVGHEHPAPVRRVTDHHRPDGRAFPHLSEAVRGGAAAGGGQGLARPWIAVFAGVAFGCRFRRAASPSTALRRRPRPAHSRWNRRRGRE